MNIQKIKLIFIVMIIFFGTILVYSQDTIDLISDEKKKKIGADTDIPGFQPYKATYMVFGDKEDQVKMQFSFKYSLFNPNYKIGFFAGYSQYMLWNLYDKSSPFKDINFNPDIFWKLESENNFAGDASFGLLDYIQLGFYEHKSNGREGIESRCFERSYAEMQLSVGQNINFGINGKYFYLYRSRLEEGNIDIDEYIGSFEAKVFLKVKGKGIWTDKEEIYARGGAGGGRNGYDYKMGWQEYGVKFRLLFSFFQPYFFVQVWHGYGETMLDYDLKETIVRGGIIL